MLTIVVLILSLAFTVAALMLVVTVAVGGISFAPWVPSRRPDFLRILALANLAPGETFMELGCGDARVLCFMASNAPISAEGIELGMPLVWIAKARTLFVRGPGRAHVRWGDFFGADLSRADVIYLFGIPETLANRVRLKLERDLKPGARVISYAFSIKGWTPDAVDHPQGKTPLYRYRFGG